jgi:hypothetical protein
MGEESPSVNYKRVASTNLSYSAKRALAPPVYEGTNLRELRDFLLGYKICFDAAENYKDKKANQDGKIINSCEPRQ